MTPSIGTILKINIHLDFGSEYTMDDVDFTCQFYIRADATIEISKEDLIRVDQSNYIAIVDSERLGAGELRLKVTAFVPDTDCDSGFRKEVVRGNTGIKIVY